MIRAMRVTATGRDARAGLGWIGLAAALLLATPISAQNDKMVPIAVPAQPDAIELDTGKLPDAIAPEAWHSARLV